MIHLYNERETESAFEIVMRHDSHGRAERERKTERETEPKSGEGDDADRAKISSSDAERPTRRARQ